jgi:hypothetical protein
MQDRHIYNPHDARSSHAPHMMHDHHIRAMVVSKSCNKNYQQYMKKKCTRQGDQSGGPALAT